MSKDHHVLNLLNEFCPRSRTILCRHGCLFGRAAGRFGTSTIRYPVFTYETIDERGESV